MLAHVGWISFGWWETECEGTFVLPIYSEWHTQLSQGLQMFELVYTEVDLTSESYDQPQKSGCS